MEEGWRGVLCALYLPGTPHGISIDRDRWPAVVGALRALCLELDLAAAGLRSKGLFAEAVALEANGALEWGREQAASGKTLTALDEGFPARWLSVVGHDGSPAFWKALDAPIPSPRWIAIVGSRNAEPEAQMFCAAVARQAVAAGYGVVSGAAVGCDRASLRAAHEAGGNVLSVLPFGIHFHDAGRTPGPALSACRVEEPFSTARAMERNALIYSAAHCTVVGSVRFREGGTWHGAVQAMRRKRSALLVRRPSSDEPEEFRRGAQALVSLGATYLDAPEALQSALELSISSESLFSSLKAG